MARPPIPRLWRFIETAMKPVYLAFAVLSPFAVGAHAQTSAQLSNATPGPTSGSTSVSVYGLLDVGVVAERGCAGCKSDKLSSGVANGSRLGVRGSEALGNDVAAIFTLEAGLLTDTGRSDQDGTLFGRQAFVGLDGKLGALTLGRQYNPLYLALTEVADPFKGGTAGSAANLVGYTVKRYNNSVRYASPTMHGLSAMAIYSFGEAAFSSAANRAYGATLGYGDGPVTLRLSHQRKNNFLEASATVPAVDNSAKNTLLAANFNFGAGTAYAAYGHNKGEGSSPWDASNPYGALVQSTPSTDSRDVLMGLAVPYGATTFMASYIRKDDRNLSDRDANQFAIGISYALSKRTDFYAAYAKIRNKNGAAYTVGNASESGKGDRAFNVGLWHSF